MALGRPGRVPVMCQMSLGHILLQTGLPPLEFWFDRNCFAEGLLRMRALYEFDGILISLHGHRDDWRKGLREWRPGEAEDEARWADGSRTFFPRDDLPRHIPPVEGRRPSIRSFDPESIPDRPVYIPVSQGLRFPIDPDRPLAVHEDLVGRAGKRFSIHGEVTSPLDYFLDLFGFAEGFLALAEEPERSKAVLGRLAESLAGLAAAQAGLGLDAVKISSPYAGARFISPRYYKEFVLPFEARIASAVLDRGGFVYTHTCGAVGDRLEFMAEAGVSGLECLDPPPLGDVDLAEAKTRVGGRLFIKGNVDPVHTLLRGPLPAIEADVRARLAAGAPGGGYILSTACSIAPATPRAHVQALSALAAEIS